MAGQSIPQNDEVWDAHYSLRTTIRRQEQRLKVQEDQIADLKDQRDLWQKQASQVLITSQFSQKQAEELRAELKEREARARARRERVVADFLIGAHALLQCDALITRDASFYRDYFKGLKVIVPQA